MNDPLPNRAPWVHEHQGHPDFKFVVTAKFVGDTSRWSYSHPDGTETPYTTEDIERDSYEKHAVIYADKYIAVTMFECCYAMWYLRDGKIGGGCLWKKGEWELTPESVAAIKELNAGSGKQVESES